MSGGGPPSICGEDAADLLALQLTVLDHEQTAGVEEFERADAENTDDVKTVLSPVQRHRRIEEPYLRITRDRGVGHVRRVRDDDGCRAVEFFEGLGQIGVHESEVADARGVAPRPS